MLRRRLLLFIAVLALAGCRTQQSALHTAGPAAASIRDLAWLLFAGGAAILLLVMILVFLAAGLPSRWRGWMKSHAFVVSLGILFPIVTLATLLVYGLFVVRDLSGAGNPTLRIVVVGERWWWRVHYVNSENRVMLATANEIRIPANQVIEFVLKSDNVIHSFWAPSLAGKLDMIPGQENVYRFAAERIGIYRGQCAEYCGEQHALMAFHVVVMEPENFEAWYASQVSPTPAPATPFLAHGQELFMANGCGACHTIRGTPAEGTIGPDLSRVGERHAIAAGTFRRNVGTLAGWISSSQHLKPGNAMPSFGNLSGPDLRAIANYLESLK